MDQSKFMPQPKQTTTPRKQGKGFRKRKRVELEPGFPKPCEVCNIILNRKFEYDAHMIGKRHAKELKKKEIREKLEKEHAESVPAIGKKTEEYIVIDPKTSLRTCTACSIGFESLMVEFAHMNGKKHKMKVNTLGVKTVSTRVPLPPKKGYVGRCEVCKISYTSQAMMTTHLNGKRHKRNCGIQVQVQPGVPTLSGDKPFPKKIKLQPVITPSWTKPPAPKAKKHELLEKQAEEAYEKYKSVATTIPLEEAQELYTKYQRIYRAYEAAYQEHMMSKEETK